MGFDGPLSALSPRSFKNETETLFSVCIYFLFDLSKFQLMENKTASKRI